MTDAICAQFLQWALPRLQMRWPGFRKVRGQLCKRLARRIRQLQLTDVAAYQAYLQAHPAEWDSLDKLCRITLSRFYRDRQVFAYLGRQVLPALIQRIVNDGDSTLYCWSAGCASGEEAYTLALLWNLMVRQDYPDVELQITATDVDPVLLARAKRACYSWSSLRELPDDWRVRAFTRTNSDYCLKPAFRSAVNFLVQDIRQTVPNGLFHLVLCRNLVFTYFAVEQQRDILKRMRTRLLPGGVLVIGVHESLPEGMSGFCQWLPEMPIYRCY